MVVDYLPRHCRRCWWSAAPAAARWARTSSAGWAWRPSMSAPASRAGEKNRCRAKKQYYFKIHNNLRAFAMGKCALTHRGSWCFPEVLWPAPPSARERPAPSGCSSCSGSAPWLKSPHHTPGGHRWRSSLQTSFAPAEHRNHPSTRKSWKQRHKLELLLLSPLVWACWPSAGGRSLTSVEPCTHWSSAGSLPGRSQRCRDPAGQDTSIYTPVTVHWMLVFNRTYASISFMILACNIVSWCRNQLLTTSTSGSILCILARKNPSKVRSVPAISTLPFWKKRH